MASVTELLEYLRKRFRSWDGLIVLLVLVGLIGHCLSRAAGPHIAAILSTIHCPSVPTVCHCLYLGGMSLTLSLAALFWWSHRRLKRFGAGELGIVFAPNFAEALEDDAARLFVSLQQELKAQNFGSRLALRKLPPNLTIDCAEDAVSLLQKAGGIVAIWGALDEEQTSDGRAHGFAKMSYTFLHHTSVFSSDRQKALAIAGMEKRFRIRERAQIDDRQVMARDIALVVKNIIGVTLMMNSQYAAAAAVFAPLCASLQSVAVPRPASATHSFFRQVQYDLAWCLTMTTSEEYRKYLFSGRLFEIPEDVIRCWLASVTQASVLDPKNGSHSLVKGVYHFLLGELTDAITAELRASRLVPRDLATANLGLAFLYNFRGECKRSSDQYRLGLAKDTALDEEVISQCISFVSQCVSRYPEKKQLKLALALLKSHGGSEDSAKRLAEELINDPPPEPRLQGFVTQAKQLLDRIGSLKTMRNGDRHTP